MAFYTQAIIASGFSRPRVADWVFFVYNSRGWRYSKSHAAQTPHVPRAFGRGRGAVLLCSAWRSADGSVAEHPRSCVGWLGLRGQVAGAVKRRKPPDGRCTNGGCRSLLLPACERTPAGYWNPPGHARRKKYKEKNWPAMTARSGVYMGKQRHGVYFAVTLSRVNPSHPTYKRALTYSDSPIPTAKPAPRPEHLLTLKVTSAAPVFLVSSRQNPRQRQRCDLVVVVVVVVIIIVVIMVVVVRQTCSLAPRFSLWSALRMVENFLRSLSLRSVSVSGTNCPFHAHVSLYTRL